MVLRADVLAAAIDAAAVAPDRPRLVMSPRGRPLTQSRVAELAAGPVAVARSEHFGYDLDGVVLLPGEGLGPGAWLPGRFAAVTPYDVLAEHAD